MSQPDLVRVRDVMKVDFDVVDISNLQRQVLFDEGDVASGRAKAEAVARRVARARRRQTRRQGRLNGHLGLKDTERRCRPTDEARRLLGEGQWKLATRICQEVLFGDAAQEAGMEVEGGKAHQAYRFLLRALVYPVGSYTAPLERSG